MSRSLPLINRRSAVGLLLAAALAGSAFAQALPAPQDRVILEVAGALKNANAADRARLDLKMLEEIGVSRVTTSTPWTEGKPVFEGVLIRDLLKRLGATGTTVTPVAINDYKIDIPRAELEKYPVLLAFKMNGEPLRVRDKGPLWIIYPRDEFPELDTKPIQSRWVWQVKELRIR
jgi:hypothetical protein